MIIIGAGAAGLIAASMLRRYHPVVHEKAVGLPENHSAVLRFRNEDVSGATGIPFKKVLVHKAVKNPFTEQLQNESTLQLSNLYSIKVTGRVINRSILNLQPAERWIAPADFLQLMAGTADIHFGSMVNLFEDSDCKEPAISTMPMPILMDQMDWNPIVPFLYSPIFVLTAKIEEPHIDIYQTIYYPDANSQIYRASVTGNNLIVECMDAPCQDQPAELVRVMENVLWDFGLNRPVLFNAKMKKQQYGKIVPIDDSIRKAFIHSMSEKYHIYSLGRYATWRNILLDDLVKDINFIDSFIRDRDLYSAYKAMIK